MPTLHRRFQQQLPERSEGDRHIRYAEASSGLPLHTYRLASLQKGALHLRDWAVCNWQGLFSSSSFVTTSSPQRCTRPAQSRRTGTVLVTGQPSIAIASKTRALVALVGRRATSTHLTGEQVSTQVTKTYLQCTARRGPDHQSCNKQWASTFEDKHWQHPNASPLQHQHHPCPVGFSETLQVPTANSRLTARPADAGLRRRTSQCTPTDPGFLGDTCTTAMYSRTRVQRRACWTLARESRWSNCKATCVKVKAGWIGFGTTIFQSASLSTSDASDPTLIPAVHTTNGDPALRAGRDSEVSREHTGRQLRGGFWAPTLTST